MDNTNVKNYNNRYTVDSFKHLVINRDHLLQTQNSELRRVVLDVIEETLYEMNAYKIFLMNITLSGSILHIGNKEWDIKKYRNIYIVCGGKAASATAMALETILGTWITKGVVIVKKVEPNEYFSKCEVFIGGHPLPNLEGYQGCQRIFKMLSAVNSEDLVISAISGGTSALMAYPKAGLSLEEDILTTDVLLKSGANIHEINAVRRHISRVNGGNLAKFIEDRGAEIILLMYYDTIGAMPTESPWMAKPVYGGPMAPDPTTLQDARNTIRNYGLRDKLPKNIVDFLDFCTDEEETPKSLKRHTSFVVNTLPDLCECAKNVSESKGIKSYVLSSSLVGSSQQAGSLFADIAKEIRELDRPFKPPCMIIASGEVYTLIEDPRTVHGSGGPGQEMATAFALHNGETQGVCFASIDSEGTDGPTQAAGAIVDWSTFIGSKEKNINLSKSLQNHATFQALDSLNSIIYTGNTGTTLCDLHLLYII